LHDGNQLIRKALLKQASLVRFTPQDSLDLSFTMPCHADYVWQGIARKGEQVGIMTASAVRLKLEGKDKRFSLFNDSSIE